MKKSDLFLIFFGSVFSVGIFILMTSLNLGKNEVLSLGDSVDTGAYLICLEQSLIKYRYLGSILSILGGLGGLSVLLDIYKKSK